MKSNNLPFLFRAKRFSIIELMTVVFIILLLMTLMIPTFLSLKMNARAAICKGQLRQIGTLFTSYQSEHNGYLPNDTAVQFQTSSWTFIKGDIPTPVKKNYYDYGPNNELYKNWNGHLLPYLDVNLPDGFTRHAMVTKVGCTRFQDGQLGGPANPPPANVLSNGWIVIDDALNKGGYQDLKAFICPEIHQGTFDVAAALWYNNVRIPRIAQLCYGEGFRDQPGYDYGMSGGIPTTYLANDIFFGLDSYWNKNNINSLRMDQISDVSQKAFLIEGGSGTVSGDLSSPYYSNDLYNSAYGGALRACFDKSRPWVHKLSYVHDNYDKFWITIGGFRFPDNPPGINWANCDAVRKEFAEKFNVAFAGKACMVANGIDSGGVLSGYEIVSYVEPENGAIFKTFMDANWPGWYGMGYFQQFTDEPNDFKYLVGNMNVLFGDGSVLTKDQSWLCNNRDKIALQ